MYFWINIIPTVVEVEGDPCPKETNKTSLCFIQFYQHFIVAWLALVSSFIKYEILLCQYNQLFDDLKYK